MRERRVLRRQPHPAADSTQDFGAQGALGAARRYDGMATPTVCDLSTFPRSSKFTTRTKGCGREN